MGSLTQHRIALDLDPAHRVFGDAASARAAPRGWDFLGLDPGAAARKNARRHCAGDAGPCRPRRRLRSNAACRWGRAVARLSSGCAMCARWRISRSFSSHPSMAPFSTALFTRRHVERGAFSGCQPQGAAEVFARRSHRSASWIGVYAVAPFVLLIDQKRLGARPVPQSWADLADPLYRGEVVFSGWRREGARDWSAYNQFFLVFMLRLLGRGRIRARWSPMCRSLMHSAQMPRHAGAASSKARSTSALGFGRSLSAPRGHASGVAARRRLWPIRSG